MRVLILNQYFPPDPAPTGVLFGELSQALRDRGHEMVHIDAGHSYRESQKRGGRLLREFRDLWRMLITALFSQKVDVVLSGSSPPCLAVIGMLVALRHRARHYHWCMDVYPEIALALRELRPGVIAALIRFAVRIAYRSAAGVIALDADMAAVLGRYGIQAHQCRPWVPLQVAARIPIKPTRLAEPWCWLYSGNLGRAHEWQTLVSAQLTLEERGIDATLVFQGGGPSQEAAAARARELGVKRIEWRPYAPEAELCSSLLRAGCLIVTELPEVRGLLWPSKLALLLGLPRPILYVGARPGAIADLLETLPGARVVAPGDFRSVADAVEQWRTDPPMLTAAVDVPEHRRESLDWWISLVENG